MAPETSEESTDDLPEKPTWLKWFLIRILSFTGLLYLAAVVFLAVNETQLVYPGAPVTQGNWEPGFLKFEEVELKAQDGTKIVGWYIPSAASDLPGGDDRKSRNVLICHGNGENVAMVASSYGVTLRDLLSANVFIYDYRGYGKSEGTPDEAGILQDSVAAMDYLCERSSCKPEDVILVGHSLGGGPAVYLAKEKGCKMMILQRTYSSLPDAGAYNYPIFPVQLIMQNRMESAKRIVDCPQPLFQSHGTADKLIPFSSGKKLNEASSAEKNVFFEVEGMGHWDPLPPNYWRELKAFVIDVDPLE